MLFNGIQTNDFLYNGIGKGFTTDADFIILSELQIITTMPRVKSTVAPATSQSEETIVNNPTASEAPATESTFASAVAERKTVPTSFLLSLIGRDTDEIADKMASHPAITAYDNVRIKNVIAKKSATRDDIILVLATKIPVFVLDRETEAYVESTSSNLFVSRMQLVALAKNSGQLVLAKQIATADELMLGAIMANARVSFTGYYMAEDMLYVNPYSSIKPDEEKESNYSSHESYRYDISEIAFGKLTNIVNQVNAVAAFAKASKALASVSDDNDDDEFED